MTSGSGFEREVMYRLSKIDQQFDRLGASIDQSRDTMANEISNLKVEIGMLKVKSGLWGAAAGLVPAALLVIYEILKGA